MPTPASPKLRPFEELAMRTPIPGHREALRTLAAPLTPTTFATATLRRGLMKP